MTRQPDPADIAKLVAITEARARGITWASIASALRLPNGKAAHALAKRLARQADRIAAMTAREDHDA